MDQGNSLIVPATDTTPFGLRRTVMLWSRKRIRFGALTVNWPDGASTTWTNVSADQWITLSRVPGDCQADGIVDGNDIQGFAKHLVNAADAPLCLAFSTAGDSASEQIIAFIDALTN